MRKFGLLLSVSFILFTQAGCLKDNNNNTTCTNKTVDSERAAIVAYAQANGITAVELNNTGLYYQIITPGTGPVPNLSSTVSTKYIGKLLNGTVFDQTTTSAISFSLSRVISGWQLGIPLLKKGGKIKLIIPSSLGYGCTGSGATIPGDSILFFEIELTDVQ